MMKKLLTMLIVFVVVITTSALVSCTVNSDNPEGEVVKYTITFDCAGGTPVEAMEVEGSDYQLPVTTKEGYTFAGWTLDGQTFSAETLTGNITLVAQWTLASYTLEFNGADSLTVEYGSVIGALPSVPDKAGYTNDGKWYVDGEEITAETIWSFTENKYANGNYTANTDTAYTVRYFKQTGYESFEEVADDAEVLHGATDSRTNFALDEDNPKTYDGYVLSEIEQAVIKADGSAVVKVLFVKQPLTVTLVLNNGAENIEVKDVPCYIPATEFNALAPVPVKEGHSFDGWLLEGVKFEGETMLESNVTLEALWKANTYAIWFEEGEVESLEVTYGQPVGVLPAITAEAGKVGVWEIDGVAITAETVWNYTRDKDAVAAYYTTVANPVTSITVMAYKPESSAYGTYYVDGRCFTGFYRTVVNYGGYVDFGIVNYTNEAIDAIIAGAPEGYNAVRMWIWYDGSAPAEPNADTLVGGSGNGFPNAIGPTTIPAKTWGSQTVPLSLVTASSTGYTDFGRSFYARAQSWLGNAYYYYEYVQVKSTLSFGEGIESRQLLPGDTIGELPEVPEQSGYEGFWTIDGNVITAETVWNYATDKTAVVAYYTTVAHPVTSITAMAYKPESSAYGTYYVDGRCFTGFYRTVVNYGGYVDFGIVNFTNEAIDAIIAGAPEGYNAVRMWIWYDGSAPNEPNADTLVGFSGDGHPNAIGTTTIPAKTWGSQTVPLSLVTASSTGYADFGYSMYAYALSWLGNAYYYYEYVTVE